MSIGLFGAYTGSPRLQRAYASTCSQTETVTNELDLQTALMDATVTCIEIDGTIALTADLPVVDDTKWDTFPRETEGLSIFGTGDDTIAGGGHQGLHIDLTTASSASIILQLSNLTMTGFQGSEGAAFKAYLKDQSGIAEVDIDNVTGMYNDTDQSGAVINVRSMTGEVDVTVTDSSFSDNVSRWGGAVYVYGSTKSTTTVADTMFTSNEASTAGSSQSNDGDGGALWANSAGEIIVNIDSGTSFVDNKAEQRGGAIFSGWVPSTPGSVDIAEGATFTGNVAGARTAGCVPGPGVFCYPSTGGAVSAQGSVTVTGNAADPVLFSSNHAAGSGGAIHAAGPVSIGAGTLFDNNVATATSSEPGDGGAIFTASTLTVLGTELHPVIFADDSATNYGGAVFATDGGSITSAVFEGNTADWGGAAYSSSDGWTFNNSTIKDNVALNSAGGVYTGSGATTIYGSAIIGNQADVTAGGVGISSGPLTVENSFIGYNSVGTYPGNTGGGIRADGDVHLRFATVYGNSAGTGASEIQAQNVTSVMSVVGNSTTGNIWDFAGTLDDSYSVSTADDTEFGGFGSHNVAPGALDFEALSGTAPGAPGRTPNVASALANAVGSGGFAPTTNPVPGVTHDQLGILRVAPFTIGARQVVPPSPPNPPAPAPSVPASAPMEVRAEAGVESAEVSWLPPSNSGSFPVTTYQAVASPGGQACLVAAPALTCTITGLTPGTPYTVTARTLTGAGWSEASSPSSVVVPLGPEVPAILITNSRDRAQKSMARVEGTTTGLVGAEVIPYLRIAGRTAFSPGTNTRTVDADGNFVWQRKVKKRFAVYFVSGDVTSNRLVIRPE